VREIYQPLGILHSGEVTSRLNFKAGYQSGNNCELRWWREIYQQGISHSGELILAGEATCSGAYGTGKATAKGVNQQGSIQSITKQSYFPYQ